jgi:hypothetical protein
MLLLVAFFMLAAADKGYYGNGGGSMNDAGDMEVHISMPSQKSGHPRCEEINIPMCRGKPLNCIFSSHTLIDIRPFRHRL